MVHSVQGTVSRILLVAGSINFHTVRNWVVMSLYMQNLFPGMRNHKEKGLSKLPYPSSFLL